MLNIFRSLVLSCFTIYLLACVNQSSYREGIDSFEHQDYRSAFIRLKPWAEKGNKDAQYAVGYMYYYGQGVVEDKKEAYVWIKCAANQGQEQASAALKIMHESETSDE